MNGFLVRNNIIGIRVVIRLGLRVVIRLGLINVRVMTAMYLLFTAATSLGSCL